jgi:aspartyl-tRNA(Asn)/glutamyl-tRNA(Gln) amidotransferase subunit C
MILYDALFALIKREKRPAPAAFVATPDRRATAPGNKPMTLTLQDVERIAHLARIEISAGEAADVHAKLDAIFAMINELASIDTTGIVPMSHAQDMTMPLRDDRVTETDQRARFQQQAPAVEDGLYLVPRVVE